MNILPNTRLLSSSFRLVHLVEIYQPGSRHSAGHRGEQVEYSRILSLRGSQSSGEMGRGDDA